MTPQPVKLFNTLSRETELLKPIDSEEVSIYCCGPTVYNYQHIGNLRTYIFEDILVRTLRYAGYQVKHVMNITDVGHLVSDADEGEDKMLVAAKREGKTSYEIAAYYTDVFFEHCKWLNIIRPDVVCKATDHISQMIDQIRTLEERGYAYQSGGNVYYDVSKFPEYGKLARLDLDKLQAGARIEVDQKKRNPLDFVLWFTKSKFENQELQWDSPWGRGYPGWHIECSAMALEYLGETFDIHCGGIDHIPVHHTNEIAQAEGASGKTFANVWMHGGFLVTDKQKMSKSTGEFLTLDKISERKFDPLSYRLLCLSGSYRQELSWNWEAQESANNTLKRLKNQVSNWREELGEEVELPSDQLSEKAEEFREQFDEAVFNDLGMAKALAVLHGVAGANDLSPREKLSLFYRFDQILGLGVENWRATEIEIPQEILALVQTREDARRNKDWAKSDEIRDELLAKGFVVEDTPEGPKIKKQES